MVVPCHRVLAVIGKLCVKPFVQRLHQLWIIRHIAYFGTLFQLPIMNLDFAWLRCLKLGKPRHFCAVYVGRIREITSGKLCSDLFQMFAYQSDLRGVTRIFHDNLLDAAHLYFRENMSGCLEIEWHDIGTAFRNSFLPGFVRCKRRIWRKTAC